MAKRTARGSADPAELCEHFEALLQAQREEQQDEVRALREEIAALRAETGKRFRSGPRGRKPILTRAALLKGAAAGVAGLAASELGGSLGATPAFAHTTSDNNFIATGGAGIGIQVGAQTTSDYAYSHGAFMYGYLTGVYGESVDSTGMPNGGTGVSGVSGSGYGVYASANSGNGLYATSGTGYGVYATSIFAVGGYFAGGTTGVQAVEGSGSGTGVEGDTTGGTGVLGKATTGIGVNGSSTSGTGVEGISSTGFALLGLSSSGTGVYGFSSNGIGAQFGGGSAALLLNPSGSSGAPTTGKHNRGELVVDSTGVPYICATGDSTTLGTWQAIGNLRSFPTPRRLFGAFVGNGSSYGPVDATKKLNGTASGVPAGASAVYAAVQSDQPGRLTLYPDGTTDPGIANWTNNGTGGILFLTYMLIPLSAAGAFRFHSYIAGNVYVDAWGYLL